MKVLLTKEEVASVLAEYYGNQYGVYITSVRVTPFGEHIAEIAFNPQLKWEPPPPTTPDPVVVTPPFPEG